MMRRTGVAVAAAALLAAITTTPAHADGIRDSQWHLGFLDVATAHRSSQGANITVAVVDSGVDATHPDLAGSVLSGMDLTGAASGAAAPGAAPGPAPSASPTTSASPGTGTVTATGASGQSDVDGRGTGLAGLIVGHGHTAGTTTAGTPGQDGVLGIAPAARILPIAITSRAGQFGDPDLLAAGIDEAVARGASVICVGRGLPPSPRLEQAVANAIRANTVIVAPVANRRGDGFLPWPARYPGVVAVAPLDRAGGLAVPPPGGPAAASPTPQASPSPQAGQDTTSPAPTIAAPGIDLVTTDANGGYRFDAGTGAAAIVAGAAALIKARYPQLSAAEIVHRLTATATDRGPNGRDTGYGYGVLNLTAAITQAVPALTGPSPTQAASPTASAAPPALPEPVAKAGLPAFDSKDWRRWLVALPLIAFMIGLIGYAVRGRPPTRSRGRPTARAR
jgi:hypothetical protein